ncbi:radical SAM/SPASM domain-containing protein [Pseudoflavonifractor phocaeensis]|uniref:radical SAM/SPASM domain-containing protein n=1 Tax=Pseudoflavonifractor phocaeensis TaxID=1870988 RepID=UPI00195A24F6|nr:radical SAM protein [Pseudoflavonifractor phocaeensis]MBM6924671.1 radical SAM protein [Pseudoflavonifractor phocaeensis]
MFYRLNPGYRLRGWEKLTQALVFQQGNQIRPLTANELQTLLLCDGETDLTGFPVTPEMEATLHAYEAEGVVAACTQPVPLETEQYYQYYHNRFVRSIFWSVTGRCNYRCRHCFMDAPDARLGELSTTEALDLIDQMAQCGVLQVDLTGGEPLVRKDLWQLIDRILEHKMIVGKLYTNGWLLDDTVIEQFARRGISPDISISFDGTGWHDWMRGISGAEQAALRAFRLCRDYGLKTDAEMCIHRGNINTLPQTIEVLQTVGVDELKVSNVSATPLWQRHSQGNALTQREYVEGMLPYISWYYRTGRPIRRLTLGGIIVLSQDSPYVIVPAPYDGTESCLDHHLCQAARFACYITPEGRLLPCMPMTSSPYQELFPKIQDIGLRQGLSDSYYMQFVNSRVRDLMAANKECAACKYRYYCGGGCRATALIDGDCQLMGCDRQMCFAWKNGYTDRIRHTAEQAVETFWPQHSGTSR